MCNASAKTADGFQGPPDDGAHRSQRPVLRTAFLPPAAKQPSRIADRLCPLAVSQRQRDDDMAVHRGNVQTKVRRGLSGVRAGVGTQRRELLTPGHAIRRFCLECVGADSARAAFDCLCAECVLYPAHPWRDKPMPVSKQPLVDGKVPERILAEERRLAERCQAVPKRRASREMIRAFCRDCQPGDRTDCEATGCPLYPYRPWPGPGHPPKRQRTARQRAAASRGLAIASQNARNALTEGHLGSRDGRS